MSVTINLHVHGDTLEGAVNTNPEAGIVLQDATPPATAEPEPFDLADYVAGDPVSTPTNEDEDEWFRKRSGRLTCSRFGDLMMSGRKKDDPFSQTGYAYLRLKIAERLGSYQAASSAAMQWGTDNEAEALRQYGMRRGVEVNSAPYQFFELGPDVGGTPDGLIGDDGCVEVKCPYNPAVHVNTLIWREVPAEYRWQVAGHCLVTGRAWCDFVSFDPRITGPRKMVVVRWERDETMIEELQAKLDLAVEWINTTMEALQ